MQLAWHRVGAGGRQDAHDLALVVVQRTDDQRDDRGVDLRCVAADVRVERRTARDGADADVLEARDVRVLEPFHDGAVRPVAQHAATVEEADVAPRRLRLPRDQHVVDGRLERVEAAHQVDADGRHVEEYAGELRQVAHLAAHVVGLGQERLDQGRLDEFGQRGRRRLTGVAVRGDGVRGQVALDFVPAIQRVKHPLDAPLEVLDLLALRVVALARQQADEGAPHDVVGDLALLEAADDAAFVVEHGQEDRVVVAERAAEYHGVARAVADVAHGHVDGLAAAEQVLLDVRERGAPRLLRQVHAVDLERAIVLALRGPEDLAKQARVRGLDAARGPVGDAGGQDVRRRLLVFCQRLHDAALDGPQHRGHGIRDLHRGCLLLDFHLQAAAVVGRRRHADAQVGQVGQDARVHRVCLVDDLAARGIQNGELAREHGLAQRQMLVAWQLGQVVGLVERAGQLAVVAHDGDHLAGRHEDDPAPPANPLGAAGVVTEVDADDGGHFAVQKTTAAHQNSTPNSGHKAHPRHPLQHNRNMQHPCPFTLFNNKLVDFLDDLKGVIGHLPEYSLMASSARFLAQFQLRQNHELFARYVVEPYGASIMARDESFLLGESFGMSGASVVTLIKSVWGGLDASDRDSIWSHMHVLMFLSKRCSAVCAAPTCARV